MAAALMAVPCKGLSAQVTPSTAITESRDKTDVRLGDGSGALHPLQAGAKKLIVQTRDGAQHTIGSVFFEPVANLRMGFRVQLNHAVLQDYFLSMREFKCLPSAVEVSCFVPYPYRHPNSIAAGDLAWLEHNLLFLYKQPRDFGAKLWNGMIFKLSGTETGFIGHPQAVDLNRISGPPDDLSTPPYGPFDRDDFAPGARWIEVLKIE